MPVYVDVLLVVNGFVNYLMLLCVMKFLRVRTGRIRILLGATLGSLISLKIFLPSVNAGFDVLIRIVACILIVSVSFKIKSFKFFIRAVASFLAVSFTFGGLISAVIYFIKPGILLYENGTVYFNISFFLLAALSVTSFAVISMVQKILERRAPNQSIYEVTVEANKRKCSGRALADTGNSLREPFFNTPVIVAQYSSVKNIAPTQVCKYCENSTYDNITSDIRLIPVSTVNSNGFLPAFKADFVTVTGISVKKKISNVYIAVSKQKLCSGEFEFILNTEILEDNIDDEFNKSCKKSFSKNL